MPRTITVTGIGRATARPDTVIISMTKESQDKDYDRAMQIEGDGIDGDFEITDLPSAFYFLCCERCHSDQ